MQGGSASERFKELEAFATRELGQAQSDLGELRLLIRQTTGEVERWARRGDQATAKQREAEANLDGFSRQELRQIYTTAAESQLRLLMMQSQVELLQSRQNSLERYIEALQKTVETMAGIGSPTDAAGMAFPAFSTPAAVTTAIERRSGPPAAGRVIQALEAERGRVASQIHDGPVQALTNVVLRAEVCERLVGRDPTQAREELVQLKEIIASTLRATRRFIFDLRPMILDDLGLLPTLGKYVEVYREKSKFDVELTAVGRERRLGPLVELTAFRLVQEALQNVAQHANASKARITVELEGEQTSVIVEDDGIGFDVDAALAGAREDSGIRGMIERVEALGGRLSLASSPGRGTRVVATLPTPRS